jgi:hypothetical protein
MDPITETLSNPRKAALIGAATGAAKGILVGAVAGKLLLFTAVGAAGGAATGAALSWFSRRAADRFDETQELGA